MWNNLRLRGILAGILLPSMETRSIMLSAFRISKLRSKLARRLVVE